MSSRKVGGDPFPPEGSSGDNKSQKTGKSPEGRDVQHPPKPSASTGDRAQAVFDRFKSEHASSQPETFHDDLMRRTGNKGTKESMYALSITDIDGYLEKLGDQPQYAKTVNTLKACRRAKVDWLSKVDKVLGSLLGEGGGIHSRMVDSYSLDQCREAITYLDHESLPEHEEAVDLLESKVFKNREYMKKLGPEPTEQEIFNALSVPEISDFLKILKGEGETSLVNSLQYCRQRKLEEFDSLNSILFMPISPENPNISEKGASYLTSNQCIRALDMLERNPWIPECKVNIPILESWLAEIEQQMPQGEQVRESTPTADEYMKQLFQDAEVKFPLEDGTMESTEYGTVKYIATKRDCIEQANCLREFLIQEELFPEDEFAEATDLGSARKFARKVVRYIHPDTAKIEMDKEVSQVMIGIAMTISGNADELRKKRRGFYE